MKKLTRPRLELAVGAVLANAGSDYDEHAAFARVLDQNIPKPSTALLAGTEVQLHGFGFDGNVNRGVTAKITAANGKTYRVAAADVELTCGGSGADYHAVYRHWLGLPAYAQSSRAPAKAKTLETADFLFLALQNAPKLTCLRLATGERVFLRLSGTAVAAPGEILTVDVEAIKDGVIHGRLRNVRLDARALGLTPLALNEAGMWDPQDHYWGEDGDVPEKWEKAQQLWGPRPEFEMEQVIPGADPDNFDSDPIIEAADATAAGRLGLAMRILFDLCAADLRCLDAHAHLGNLWFQHRPALAIRHYEVGVRIGELSLGENFNGLLPWGMIDNRPFLRCLNGYGLCLWRLERFDEAAQVFDRMLWLNPTDNQGVRFIIDEVAGKRPWRDEE
ncbi:MAG: hypothetical protein JNK48_31715 [Bryobacterales bacterium]|nr:hypothetical protein [Bryobacterales bacterium]